MLRLREGFGTDGGELVRLQGLIGGLPLGRRRRCGAGLPQRAHRDRRRGGHRAGRRGPTSAGPSTGRSTPASRSTGPGASCAGCPAWTRCSPPARPAGWPRAWTTWSPGPDQDEFARSVIMAGGGLLPEHVPWLARAGVRAFQVGAAVRPLGSAKAYVDADLVRTWRTLIDDAVRRAPRAGDDGLHRPADLARPRPALVAPGQRHLVRRAARLRRPAGHPAAGVRARPLRRGRRALRRRARRRCPEPVEHAGRSSAGCTRPASAAARSPGWRLAALAAPVEDGPRRKESP